MDYFEHGRRLGHVKQSEADGRVADNMDVRMDLMRRVHAGEISLETAQAELKRIQRAAKAKGQVTRAQAYRGR